LRDFLEKKAGQEDSAPPPDCGAFRFQL
jgi:hypothetical protein